MKEIIKEQIVVETIKLAPEIYEDGLKPSIQEAGGIIATLFGLVNNVLLYKPKTWVVMYKHKAEQFEKEYKKRIEDIPKEHIGDPDINVVGPLLDSLKYNLDEEKIREMFLNLLVKSIDDRTSSKVHPSYVRIISQMNSIDALVLKTLYEKYGSNYIKAGKINIALKGTTKHLSEALPEWIIEDDFENLTIFDISETLVRLSNYGLITLMYDRTTGDSNIGKLFLKNQVQSIFNENKKDHPNTELKGTDCIIYINDFGKKLSRIVF